MLQSSIFALLIICILSCNALVHAQSPSVQAEARYLPSIDDIGFASSLALDGSHVIVGAQGASDIQDTSGAAYFYSFSDESDVSWNRTKGPDSTYNEGFGWHVALSYPHALISAPRFNSSAGKVYLYKHNNISSMWTYQEALLPAVADSGAAFGAHLDISGDHAIVGANGDDTALGANSGSAWIFERDPGAMSAPYWTRIASPLLPSRDAVGAGFGQQVAISGNFAAVSAPYSSNGHVYLYQRTAALAWSEISVLSDGSVTQFGLKIAFSDPLLLVAGQNSPVGLYRRQGTTWQVEIYPDPADGELYAARSLSLSESGDLMAVSDPRGVFVYSHDDATWQEIARYDPRNESDVNFGSSLSISTPRLLIGSGNIVSEGGVFYLAHAVCISGKFGVNCSQECTCVNGTCNEGVAGDGLCSTCNTPRVRLVVPFQITKIFMQSLSMIYHSLHEDYGLNCDQQCDCGEGGACLNGTAGNGACTTCLPGYFGTACEPCTCINGTCLDGSSGSGECTSCHSKYFGKDCDQFCVCKNGICRDGVDGDGLCTSCFLGYNGTNCEVGDECALQTDNCSPNANCTDTLDNYLCTCKSGYRGDGRTCTDIDECEEGLDDCAPVGDGGQCTNLPGSFRCSCRSGYFGNGRSCSGNECLTSLNDCHVYADCIDTDGSFRNCSCKPGFTGDGYQCTDVDECVGAGCANKGTCLNFPGDSVCIRALHASGSVAPEVLAFARAVVEAFPTHESLESTVNPGVVGFRLIEWEIFENGTFAFTVTDTSRHKVGWVSWKIETATDTRVGATSVVIFSATNTVHVSRLTDEELNLGSSPAPMKALIIAAAVLALCFRCSVV